MQEHLVFGLFSARVYYSAVIIIQALIFIYIYFSYRQLDALYKKVKRDNQRLMEAFNININRMIFSSAKEPTYPNATDIWINTQTGEVKAYSGHPNIGWVHVDPSCHEIYREMLLKEGRI